MEHALISLLALNGLRVSEGTGASIEDMGIERGHRTLVITRKGGKVVTIPLAPRTARAIDLAHQRGSARRRKRPWPATGGAPANSRYGRVRALQGTQRPDVPNRMFCMCTPACPGLRRRCFDSCCSPSERILRMPGEIEIEEWKCLAELIDSAFETSTRSCFALF
jgi:integrase